MANSNESNVPDSMSRFIHFVLSLLSHESIRPALPVEAMEAKSPVQQDPFRDA